MINIRIDDYDASLPGSFNEMSIDQLVSLANNILFGYNREDVLLRCALEWLNIKVDVDKRNTYVFPDGSSKKITSLDLTFIVESLKFLYNADNLATGLFLQRLPEMKVGTEIFLGPHDIISNTTWEEFIMAQSHYSRFLHFKDESHALQLIATLYRPASGVLKTDPDFEGDLREGFNGFLTEERAGLIGKMVKPEIRAIVIWFYAGCLEFLDKEFPSVLSRPKMFIEGEELPASAIQQSDEDWTDPFSSLMNLTDSLANEDATKVKEIRQCNTWDILRRLHNAFEKAKRDKENYEKFKQKNK